MTWRQLTNSYAKIAWDDILLWIALEFNIDM
jgi:hypothetical protein